MSVGRTPKATRSRRPPQPARSIVTLCRAVGYRLAIGDWRLASIPRRPSRVEDRAPMTLRTQQPHPAAGVAEAKRPAANRSTVHRHRTGRTLRRFACQPLLAYPLLLLDPVLRPLGRPLTHCSTAPECGRGWECSAAPRSRTSPARCAPRRRAAHPANRRSGTPTPMPWCGSRPP